MHFTLKAGTTDMYETHMMGFTVMTFPLNTVMALILFHILVWTAIMVIIGCLIMMHRRFVDEGLIATQWFERDWLPLILLVAVSVTGLGIWFDYSYLEGKMSQFMAITRNYRCNVSDVDSVREVFSHFSKTGTSWCKYL
jgi:hypothetical protein